MRTLRLLVAYDGTSYVGWQRQPEGESIQGLLEDALTPFHDIRPSVVGAGRTDAGVHASGQVASVHLERPHDAETLQRALNARLPPDVRVLRVEEASPSFHARFDARAKTYEYRLATGALTDPFLSRYTWHVPVRLDISRMSDAARLIEGTHDFNSFRSTGSSVQTTVRRIFESSITVIDGRSPLLPIPRAAVTDGPVVVYRVTGSGFLRHMVRALVGTLVEIGREASAPSLMRDLLSGLGRGAAGPTAPARGLCLTAVSYAEPSELVATHR